MLFGQNPTYLYKDRAVITIKNIYIFKHLLSTSHIFWKQFDFLKISISFQTILYLPENNFKVNYCLKSNQLIASHTVKGSSLRLISLCPEPETLLPLTQVAASFLGVSIVSWGRSEPRHWVCPSPWDSSPARVWPHLFPGQGNTWHPEHN